MTNVKSLIKDKVFLVTGGTGSFGKYIVAELLKNDPAEIRVFSRDEDKQYNMQFIHKNENRLRFIIGDIRDKSSLSRAIKGVDIVLHAAALKQIPSTEYNIFEAIKTNVLGAQNVFEASLENNVEKVLSISTDKAVEPVNVMGITKALQERVFTLANKYRNGAKTKFASVRYGNVVASRGSVVPLFLKQIKSGRALTITHAHMTRFILTLEEACNLVFLALKQMAGGEIFVPKIRPLKIKDLAEVMLEELKPVNNEIKEIGVRPGEKMHETLISQAESMRVVEKKECYILLPQIEIEEIGFSYKINNRKNKKNFQYSSDIGPFYTKLEIKNLLKREKII